MRSKSRTGSDLDAGGFRREGLARYLARSPSGIDKLVARGELPKPISIGRTPFWPKATIDQWLAEKQGQ